MLPPSGHPIWAAAVYQAQASLRPDTFRSRLRKKGPLLPPDDAEIQALARRLQAGGIDLLAPGQPGWLSSLDGIPDPPLLLYRRGPRNGLGPATLGPAIAVVGSRTEDPYALRIARAVVARWAALFPPGGPEDPPAGAIISGGGLGVDAAALGAAIDLGLQPIVVLPCGVDRPQPRRLTPLFEAIAEKGMLISEAAIGQAPNRAMFPDRNRLIPALARVTVVVRGAINSGSLHTLRHAARLGKPVFAVVGPIDDPLSAGLHKAIRSGLAKAMLHLDDLDVFAPIVHESVAEGGGQNARLDACHGSGPSEQRILRYLGGGSAALEALAVDLGLTVGGLMPIMLRLELQGRVCRFPGDRFGVLTAAKRGRS